MSGSPDDAFWEAMKDFTPEELRAEKEGRRKLIKAAEEDIAIIDQELKRRGETVGDTAVGDDAGKDSC